MNSWLGWKVSRGTSTSKYKVPVTQEKSFMILIQVSPTGNVTKLSFFITGDGAKKLECLSLAIFFSVSNMNLTVPYSMRYCQSWSNFWVCQIYCSFGAMLRSFSWPALPAMGVAIKMLKWLDRARWPPKYIIFKFDELQNLTNTRPVFYE